MVTFSKILVKAALSEGFDAHYLTASAASQLEGQVSAHIRIGTPAGPSPKIRRGQADAVVAMDRLEAINYSHYLSQAGVLIALDGGLIPLIARTGSGRYPSREDVEKIYGQKRMVWVQMPEMVRKSGVMGLVGAVMLGATSAVTSVVDRDHMVKALREEKPSMADLETDAFFEGYSMASGDHSFRGGEDR